MLASPVFRAALKQEEMNDELDLRSTYKGIMGVPCGFDAWLGFIKICVHDPEYRIPCVRVALGVAAIGFKYDAKAVTRIAEDYILVKSCICSSDFGDPEYVAPSKDILETAIRLKMSRIVKKFAPQLDRKVLHKILIDMSK
mmetsp:Transcript_14861/g.20818  ORF Transcript_14861/g.20818 Transcript_14861/m.20818 type:complete len:141 (+) Transcript_14861:315-737(+)